MALFLTWGETIEERFDHVWKFSAYDQVDNDRLKLTYYVNLPPRLHRNKPESLAAQAVRLALDSGNAFLFSRRAESNLQIVSKLRQVVNETSNLVQFNRVSLEAVPFWSEGMRIRPDPKEAIDDGCDRPAQDENRSPEAERLMVTAAIERRISNDPESSSLFGIPVHAINIPDLLESEFGRTDVDPAKMFIDWKHVLLSYNLTGVEEAVEILIRLSRALLKSESTCEEVARNLTLMVEMLATPVPSIDPPEEEVDLTAEFG